MERLFDNIVKAFLTPINFLLYFVIFVYFIGYLTGNADASGMQIFLIVSIIGNILAGIIGTFADTNNEKKFEAVYIYGNSKNKKGR